MPNFIINVKEKGAKKAAKNIGGLNKSLGNLASKAALAAGGFFGATMLLSGMKRAIDLAGEQELAEKTLEVALGRRSQALLDQASALQQVTTFGDEAIIAAQALIASFVDDEEQVKAATKATLDLAAAKGMDLTAAADLVSKTLGSSTNALSRYGIEVKGAVGSTDRLESLTTNLANVFGGQAAAQAETMSGKISQMSNALGDAAEAFGRLLFPLVMPLAKGLKLIGESAVSVMDAFKSMITPEKIKFITQADIETKKFKETLSGMSAVELIAVARGFDNIQVSGQHMTDTQIANALALGEAIRSNVDLQDMENQKITERAVIHEEITMPVLEKVAVAEVTIADAIKIGKKEREAKTIADLKGYALSSGSAEDAMKRVVKAESMEAVAGMISSILKTVPFPLNAILAAGAGAGVGTLIDKGLSSFATGGDFVTSGPQMMMVGDNPGGQERVQVTPLSSPNIDGPQGGAVTVNVSGNVLSQDFVEGELAENIKDAIRRGTDFGIG